MTKHWTENLPESWDSDEAYQIRVLGRSIKSDYTSIKAYARQMNHLIERMHRSEKLIDSLIGETFTEEEMEALYASDEVPSLLPIMTDDQL